MKNSLLRLVSLTENGVRDSDSESLDFMYSYLLQIYKFSNYRHILICQIDDRKEKISKDGKDISIFIKYEIEGNFKQKDYTERNMIRLEIIEKALLILADEDNNLDIEKLAMIKKDILDSGFHLTIPLKIFNCRKNKSLRAIVNVVPFEERFDIYCRIEQISGLFYEILIYSGIPTTVYFDMFLQGKWINDEKLIITGKMIKEVEFHISIAERKVEIINISGKEQPPRFELLRIGNDKEKALENFLSSQPLDIADQLRKKGEEFDKLK